MIKKKNKYNIFKKKKKKKKELYKYEIINSLYSETARKNLISNDFYEYKIEDWSKFNLNQYISFDACGYKW